MDKVNNTEGKGFLDSEEAKVLGESVERSLEPMKQLHEGISKKYEETDKNLKLYSEYQAKKDSQPFIQTEILQGVLKELKDPLIKALTEETFYLTLVLGMVTISIFLYDKVESIFLAQTSLMFSIGLIWASIISKTIGYSFGNKKWKTVSNWLMGISILFQGLLFVALMKEGFFQIPIIVNTNVTS